MALFYVVVSVPGELAVGAGRPVQRWDASAERGVDRRLSGTVHEHRRLSRGRLQRRPERVLDTHGPRRPHPDRRRARLATVPTAQPVRCVVPASVTSY